MGLLSPSHLHCTQWCEVDGWCDGDRKWTTPVRKMQGRFSMHLWPRKIRKVTVKKAVRVLRKGSLKQNLCRLSGGSLGGPPLFSSWLLFFLMREYKWRWERAWESSLYLPRAECESAVQRRLLTSKDKREKTAYVRSKPWRGSTPLPGIAICTENTWHVKKSCYNTKYNWIR